MTITKQCTDRIVTIMPDGQFTLDRVLAVQTDVVLDPTVPGYDQEAPDGHLKLLHLWPVKLLQAGRVNYA